MSPENSSTNTVKKKHQEENQVITILRHLPKYDPGDQRPIEEEEFTRLIVEDLSDGLPLLILINQFRNHRNNNPLTICYGNSNSLKGKEIITLENHCHVYRIDVLLRVPLFVQQLLQDSKHGQREKKKLWIWIEEFGDFWLGFRLLGISEDNLKNLEIFWKSRSKNQRKIKKKIWEFTSKDFSLWVVEEEGISKLGFSEKNWGFREGFQIRCGQGESKAFKRSNPNPISKRYCFGALVIGLAGALLRTGSIRLRPIGLLVQLVAISVLGKMGCIAFNKFFNF
ncbi:hypothetical protein QYF36_011787 [Acer negundo]|nr:hypothetical protein QYF36_006860 [Acer negundo]KAK4851013.1 hypothetical protein QYF36_011787 [Acer negundo]